MSLRALISRLTGRQYHWRVRLAYRDRTGRELNPHIVLTVSMDDPRGIDQARAIKKAVADKLMQHFPPVTRCNGTIYMEPQVYLGWW